jgi:hypothetical protein
MNWDRQPFLRAMIFLQQSPRFADNRLPERYIVTKVLAAASSAACVCNQRCSSMHWFRVRCGSCTALFALALGLVLTFGHVHLDGLGGYSSTRIEASANAATPAGNDVPGNADDYCALCALGYLAGTLVPAVAAALLLPVVFGQWHPPSLALRFASPALPPLPFAARAPPLA